MRFAAGERKPGKSPINIFKVDSTPGTYANADLL